MYQVSVCSVQEQLHTLGTVKIDLFEILYVDQVCCKLLFFLRYVIFTILVLKRTKKRTISFLEDFFDITDLLSALY